MPWRPSPYLHGHLVVVIDCADLDRAARFWTGVLGYRDRDPEPGPEPGPGQYRALLPVDGSGIEVLLQRTADPKHGKNRVHLDLRTRHLDTEVSRVTALGATVLTSQPIIEDDWVWHVLADPDGNEFCVLKPPPAYWPDR
jgi:catechol 2,3-dioxygenase-like lactoylglutathione lyase family enzyme